MWLVASKFLAGSVRNLSYNCLHSLNYLFSQTKVEYYIKKAKKSIMSEINSNLSKMCPNLSSANLPSRLNVSAQICV